MVNPNFREGSEWKQSDFSTLYRKALNGAAYKFKNQTIMDRLQITGDEERRAERQLQVLELRANGMTQAEIAAKTELGERTIRRYLTT